jgi:hypothetical protein
MLREMPNREVNPQNPQNEPERRRQDRRQERQPEGWPNDERRKDQRRDTVQMSASGQGGTGTSRAPQRGSENQKMNQNRPMTEDREDMTPDSLPSKDKKDNSSRQTPENWQGENFQSGTSQAQKGEGQSPKQQTVPGDRHEQKGGQQQHGQQQNDQKRREQQGGHEQQGAGFWLAESSKRFPEPELPEPAEARVWREGKPGKLRREP